MRAWATRKTAPRDVAVDLILQGANRVRVVWTEDRRVGSSSMERPLHAGAKLLVGTSSQHDRHESRCVVRLDTTHDIATLTIIVRPT
jgi:hypothetical protein